MNMIQTKIIIKTLFVFFFFFKESSSNQVLSDDLTNALEKTYDLNPKLKSERLKLFEFDELMPQAISELRPKIEGYYEKGKVDSAISGSNFISEGIRTETNAGIKLTQKIFNGGKNFYNISIAKNKILSQRFKLKNFEQTLFLDVVKIYSEYVTKKSEVKLNKKNEEFLKKQFLQVKDQFDIGEVTLTDVSIAEARLLLSESRLSQSESDLISIESKYESIVGIKPVNPELFFNFKKIEPSLDLFIELCIKNNPEIQSINFLIRSLEKHIKSLYASKLPSIKLEAEARKNRGYFKADSEREVMTAFARIDIPLYQSGFAASKIRESKKELRSLKEAKISAINDLKTKIITSWSNFESCDFKIKAYLNQIEANKKFLEGLKQEFFLGERTILDILDAEQELLESEFNLVKSYEEKFNTFFELLFFSGDLNAEFLNLNVQLFDDTKNYNSVKYKWLDILE